MSQEEKLFAFRKAINEWKRNTLFQKLNDETDPDSTDRRIKEAHELFLQIMAKIREAEKRLGFTSQEGGNNDLTIILEKLGREDTWDQAFLDKVRSSLLTDLWEYPLTFNTRLIDQFKDTPNYPTFE